MEIAIVLIGIVVSIFVLAIVGFVTVIRMLFAQRGPQRDLDTARRVVEDLFASRRVPQSIYSGVVAAIEDARAEQGLSQKSMSHAVDPVGDAMDLDSDDGSAIDGEFWAPTQDDDDSASNVETFDAPATALPPIVEARDAVGQAAAAIRPLAAVTANFAQALPPMDAPDDVPAPSTRSWREVFALFMQEKNIRWGELASGILIVGSAIGLVLSLRNQLLAVIPYFPALLFLLITAAIIAAGVYTLHRWRLRMTSRGILLIGLLLIPLNVLIGCWITGDREYQRSLGDPIYWSAIAVELTSLAALTWLAAKNLLRAYFGGILASLMGSAAYTLVLNRISDPTSSILRSALWMAPTAIFFVVGVVRIAPRMNQRSWSVRENRRVATNLGIAFFAIAVAIALLFIKWPSGSLVIALAPVLVTVSIATIWLAELVVARPRSSNATWRLIAQSLIALGTILILGALIVSQSHPTLGFATLLLSSFLFLMLCRVQQTPWMSLPAMLCIAWTTVAGTMLAFGLANGTVAWDQQIATAAFFQSLVTGRSGISLLLAAGGMASVARFISARLAGYADSLYRNLRFVLLAGVALFGVLLSLAASLLHPQDRFDVWAATLMLSTIAFVLLGTRIFLRLDRAIGMWVAGMGTGLLFGSLAHGCWWNTTTYDALAKAFGPLSPIPFALTAFSLFMALVTALFVRFGRNTCDEQTLASTSKLFSWSSIAASLAAWGSSLALISNGGWTATGLAVTLIVSWSLLAWFRNKPAESVGFALSWAVGAMFFVSEFGIGWHWYPTWTSVEFSLTCLTALVLWSLPWVGLRRWARGSRASVLFDPEGIRIEAIVATLLALISVGLIGFGLGAPVFAEIGSQWNGSICEWAKIHTIWSWHAANLGLCAVALAFGCLERVSHRRIEALVAIWIAGWALVSVAFYDAIATASALRWSISIAGLLLSVIIGGRGVLGRAWCRMASAVRFEPRLEVDDAHRLSIIRSGLAMSVVIILGITAIVTTSVIVFNHWGIAGPRINTLFGDLPKDVSYAVPIALLVATCLSYGITQRRQSLAMTGSFVFQTCVAGSLILLFVSSDPRIASVRFVQILQFVSIGMSLYGAVWYWQRSRIEGAESSHRTISLLQIHTIVNACLMLGLTGIILGKFWFDGRIASDWVKVIGGPMGIISVAILAPLFVVTIPMAHRRYRLWSIASFGAMAVAIAAIHVDKMSSYAIVAIAYGMVAVLACQFFSIRHRRAETLSSDSVSFGGISWPWPNGDWLPLGVVGLLAQSFAFQGLPQYTLASFIASLLVLALALTYSLVNLSGFGLLIAYGLAFVNAMILWKYRAIFYLELPPIPEGRIQLIVLALLAVTLVTVMFLLVRSKNAIRMPPRSFSCWPSWCAFLVSMGMTLLSLESTVIDVPVYTHSNSLQLISLTLLVAITGLQFWNVRAQCVVPTACLSSVAAVNLILLTFDVPKVTMRIFLGCSLLLVVWAAIRWHRHGLMRRLRPLRLARLVSLKAKLELLIPVMVWVFAVPVILASVGSVCLDLVWIERLEFAIMPMILALAFFYLAGRSTNEFRQLVATLLITASCILLSWVDLQPTSSWLVQYAMRALTVLASAVCLFGWLVPSLARRSQAWLITLRRITILATGLALGTLALCLVDQLLTGSGAHRQFTISTAEAGSSLLAVLAMVLALIAIAIRPMHDLFSFSISYRQGCVYAAQAAASMGIVLAGTTIPWLFQLGLKHYWPYLLMGASIAGILIAQALERRDLKVLSQPFMNLALVIPFAGAAGALLADTRTDPALVMLMAGTVYFMVSMLRQSMLASVVALIYGNGAIYCFYSKFPHFRFVEHPQLWLIPPAVSVLIAAQFNRKRLSRTDLALLRYAALGTIYVSSTIEIFIQGVGEQLSPPIILAILSLAGIFAGILFQVRAFLFVGSLFLVTAMVTMVSLAHRRFEHVWPWWAFGICTGIVILILFGLFEKRRNDLRRVAAQLQSWDL